MRTTYSFRLRDTCDAELRRQARAVNFVWNYCNERQREAVGKGRKWLTGYDLQKLTAGASGELDIHANTIQKVCEQYARSRNQHKRRWLRWRSKKSLGWVPVSTGDVVFRGGSFWFRRREYKAWVTRPIKEGQRFGIGSFSQDALGRWFINLPLEVDADASPGRDAVGIDLGLKDLAVTSSGSRIEHTAHYRRMEQRIAAAQRANKKRQMKKLHAKAKAQRKDYLHKHSTELVRQHGAIFVGNVSPSAIAKTSMSKSSLDAGWAMFKQQLQYKAIRHGVLFAEVNEAWSTQTCSQCGSVEGPKGVAGLGVRGWRCSCGAVHDRDTNAAQNILRRGLATLAEGAGA